MSPRNLPIRAKGSGVEISLRVQPKASRNSIKIESDDRIRVALTAPPVNGKANKALVSYLAEALGVPKRLITVVRGETSREKTLFIDEVDSETVSSQLILMGDS